LKYISKLVGACGLFFTGSVTEAVVSEADADPKRLVVEHTMLKGVNMLINL
tara:strand:- start:509 stop:661 length:153 start_codon:yes stop_codon:yes gene_type:complete